mgnify:CR=1 FL=1
MGYKKLAEVIENVSSDRMISKKIGKFLEREKALINERDDIIRLVSERLMESGIPAHSVCAGLVRILVPTEFMRETTLRKCCPKKFKDHSKDRSQIDVIKSVSK